MKRAEKQKAIELREKGYSLREISDKLDISKSTASIWLRNVEISNKAILRLRSITNLARLKAVETNRIKNDELRKEIENRGKEVSGQIHDKNSLNKIYCALLYWCEGGKRHERVNFVNSDPEMMRVFVTLLRNSFDLDESKFRVLVHIHEYHNDLEQKKFWSDVTGININQFHKSYLKPHTGKQKRNNYPGCASLNYYDYKIALELKYIYENFYKNMGA